MKSLYSADYYEKLNLEKVNNPLTTQPFLGCCPRITMKSQWSADANENSALSPMLHFVFRRFLNTGKVRIRCHILNVRETVKNPLVTWTVNNPWIKEGDALTNYLHYFRIFSQSNSLIWNFWSALKLINFSFFTVKFIYFKFFGSEIH